MVDAFCQYCLDHPSENLSECFNEFTQKNKINATFADFQECIRTMDTLANVDDYVLKKFLTYYKEEKNGE